MFWVILLLAQAAVPSQTDRGEALFLESPGGCGTCHSLKGKGAAIGPDLRGIARLSPSGIVTAVRSTVTQYVQVVTLKSGGSFPTMPPTGDEKTVKLYDLSKMPPELHEVDRSDIGSMAPNAAWKHPPSLRKYSSEQLADVIAYVRFAGAGIKKPVDPSEVQ